MEKGKNSAGDFIEGTIVDGVDDSPGLLDGYPFACPIPASVDKIGTCATAVHAFHKDVRIACRVQGQKGCAKGGRECGSGFGDAALCASQFGGVARQKMVAGLLGGQAVRRETGGSTPKASAARKITRWACPARETGVTLLRIWDSG